MVVASPMKTIAGRAKGCAAREDERETRMFAKMLMSGIDLEESKVGMNVKL